MFYWTESGGGDHVTKAELLRGVVAEKLTTAAREILAVVERTVSGYEAEAAGFRREIHRQEKQLELLLQPRVSLRRTALVPDEEGHEVVVLGEEEEEEEEQQAAVEDTGSLGLLWLEDEDDGDDEERAATSSRREALKDPDYQTSPRVVPPRDRSDRRRPGRPRSSDTRGLVVLRVCVLEDSRTTVLSNTVFQKYPVREVRCPPGLREEDFLDLLRSTFPQVEAQRPFDVFTSDRTKTLQPLEVAALTPEQICRSIRLSGRGHSALYIRLKSGEDPQSSTKDLGGLQGPGPGLQGPGAGLQRPGPGSPSGSATTSADESEAITGKRSFNEEAGGEPPGVSPGLLSPLVPSDRRRGRGRPRLSEEPTHHVLRVCMLEDSRADVLPHKVLDKYQVQEVRCPRGLREEDFLDLLRSRFPQLEPQKPFDVFKSDRSRRLQRLLVKTLTPEEIFKTRSPGDKTLIYIRPKIADEEEEAELSQRSDEAEPDSSSVQHVEGKGADVPSQQQEVETEEAAAAEDGGEVLDGDNDWEPESPHTSQKKRGAKEERTPVRGGKKACQVCNVWYRNTGSLIKHAWSHVDEAHGACAVCGEHFESADDLKGHLQKYKKTYDCSDCRKSFFTARSLKFHSTLHTGNRPFKCDVCGKAFTRGSTLSNHKRMVHSEKKPYKCDTCPKAFRLQWQLRAHAKVHTGRDRYRCSLCGKSLSDLRSLTWHKATHSEERRHGCGVCGKRFKLSGTLKCHEKTHTVRERPFLCHVCCKTFVSNGTLKAHIRMHSGERPFACTVCGKGFRSNSDRTAHMLVHTDEASYGCSECGRFFKRKTHLTNHERSHRGIKLFVCKVCGKPCARPDHLTVHMRTHTGERPYKCSVCDAAFTQSHCLKTHMRSHGEGTVPEPSVSTRS